MKTSTYKKLLLEKVKARVFQTYDVLVFVYKLQVNKYLVLGKGHVSDDWRALECSHLGTIDDPKSFLL